MWCDEIHHFCSAKADCNIFWLWLFEFHSKPSPHCFRRADSNLAGFNNQWQYFIKTNFFSFAQYIHSLVFAVSKSISFCETPSNQAMNHLPPPASSFYHCITFDKSHSEFYCNFLRARFWNISTLPNLQLSKLFLINSWMSSRFCSYSKYWTRKCVVIFNLYSKQLNFKPLRICNRWYRIVLPHKRAMSVRSHKLS